MKILVIHYSYPRNKRNTINEHLYSFRKYSKEQVYYLDARFGIPKFITRIEFDIVVYHYTFLAQKWDEDFRKRLDKNYKYLKCIKGNICALPQDEYVHSDSLCYFFKNYKVKTVFTCLPESEWQKVYPIEKSGVEKFETVFTGYIDEDVITNIAPIIKSHSARSIDIGYRARKLPFWLGKLGTYKWQLSEKIIGVANKYDLVLDISNKESDVISGMDWYSFLADCRVVLGSESGASLHDPNGIIRQKVNQFINLNPNADFSQVEVACFKGLDNNLDLHVVSPRHFEATVTKTCQALIEGDYNGIFVPWKHYIPIKKDWSNLEEVIEKIENITLCEMIAENAYKDIVESDQYTYSKFVEKVINSCKNNLNSDQIYDVRLLDKLCKTEKYPYLFSFLYYKHLLFDFAYQILLFLGIVNILKKLIK